VSIILASDREVSPLAANRRLEALDGLRGIAAAVVVVFHYLCMFHHHLIPKMSPDPFWLSQTPVGLLWDGRFAVSVFFALSGFVLASAADRRRGLIVSNLLTRYLRLALPVTASVLLAWLLLSVFPTAVRDLGMGSEDPSPWWQYTVQDPIPGLITAIYEGLAGNFLSGGSLFNNVLWTMQIELLGSVGIFITYWLVAGRRRIILLVLAGAIIIAVLPGHYFAFVLGALLHEAHERGLLARMPAIAPPVVLLGVLLIGAPGPQWWSWIGVPWVPSLLIYDRTGSFAPSVFASALVYAALTLPVVARLLAMAVPRWLGRVSFGLYLVHVPPLYTLAAYGHEQAALSLLVIAPVYFAGVLALAHLFTVAVDERLLQGLHRLRTALAPLELGKRALAN
jgi:peptidoglycan/LPS O-acetylase OafA/YrhL